MKTPTLTRAEAQQKLTEFIEELDVGRERDGLDWAPELLRLLRQFDQVARSDNPRREDLNTCGSRIIAYLEERKLLKGLFPISEYLNAVCNGSKD